jgi:hypothetical protein
VEPTARRAELEREGALVERAEPELVEQRQQVGERDARPRRYTRNRHSSRPSRRAHERGVEVALAVGDAASRGKSTAATPASLSSS